MFQKILIANRGEIACRIIRTAKRLGIRTAVIYSAVERGSLAIDEADEAICIEAENPRASYLSIDKIIQAAKNIHAEAIHPGYGFLSENAEFARACQQAGIIFIGPSSHALELMGQKDKAKQLMQKIGVPIIPGFFSGDQNIEHLMKAAKEMGFPLLVKATAGGGGKALGIVNAIEELKTTIERVGREAQKSFADSRVMLEKYLPQPRHIEVQIFGDNQGNYLHLFDRDCSIQRRYQKILEEAPAFNLEESLRQRLWDSAIKAAEAINYVGAGTIEFLVSGNEYYFLEMNTRLQVEHPVTEFITGIDLVEWQLLVANNNPLPVQQKDLHVRGHAIEVRICAEDPEHDFLPASGKISLFSHPKTDSYTRLENGIKQDDVVLPYYDSLLAKLIVWDKKREQALLKMQTALQQTAILDIATNLRLLQNLVHTPQVLQGDVYTSLLNDLPALTNSASDPKWLLFAAAYKLILLKQQNKIAMPWGSSEGWRLNASPTHEMYFMLPNGHRERITSIQSSFTCSAVLAMMFKFQNLTYHVEADQINTHKLFITINDNKQLVYCYHVDDRILIITEKDRAIVKYLTLEIEQNFESTSLSSSLQAPMPGTIVQVYVQENQKVKPGDRLLTLEAMKMEHTIRTPAAGVIDKLYFKVSDVVKTGATLVKLNTHSE